MSEAQKLNYLLDKHERHSKTLRGICILNPKWDTVRRAQKWVDNEINDMLNLARC